MLLLEQLLKLMQAVLVDAIASEEFDMAVPKRRSNQLIADHGLCFLLKEDYRTHGSEWSKPGFRALASYRIASWASGVKNTFFRFAALWIGRMLLRAVRNRYGIELYETAFIGRRLHIGHQNGIVIHRYATIGDDCLIRQGVTLGVGGVERLEHERYFQESAPIVEDRVDFGAGAMIVGKVRIRHDVNIGPNAVVLTDVPAYTTVMAPMAKMIQRPRKADASGCV